MPTKPKDLTGLKFNKLVVIKKAETNRARSIDWICQCECGEEKVLSSNHLTRKDNPVKSCGCLSIKKGDKRGFKSGGRTPYEGSCVLCGTNESSRWYKQCIKEGTICRSCYQTERMKDDNIRAKRNRQRKEWGIRNPYLTAIRLAKCKKMEFTLTEPEYTEKTKECFYCGDDLSKISEGIKLDRVDSNKHYTSENTVGCCRMCNVAKNNHNQEQFFSWIKRLKDRL